jgi:hypothetical protein
MSKSKPQSSAGKAPAVPGTKLPADPMSVLGNKVAKAIVKELKRLGDAVPAKRSKKLPAGSVGGLTPQELQIRLAEVALKILVRALTSRAAKGTALRMSLIAKLAVAEMGVEAEGGSPPRKAR